MPDRLKTKAFWIFGISPIWNSSSSCLTARYPKQKPHKAKEAAAQTKDANGYEVKKPTTFFASHNFYQ